MLDSLRAFSRTWIAKIFLGVLILSFALFGINNVVTGISSNTVARVADQDVTIREFQRSYQQQLNVVAQQIGSVPTTDQAVTLGIPGMVLSRLTADAAINQVTSEFGLGASDARLSVLVRQDPAFAGTLGQFDRTNFVRALQQNGFTENEYFEMQARAARRQQLAAGLFADAPVPQAAVELANRYIGDTRTIEYFVLSELSLPPVAEPTEEEIAAYLTENQSRFRTAETRTIDILYLSPEALAAAREIPEEEIAAEYERTLTSLTRPERRRIQQVVLSAEAVDLFTAGAAAGRPFADMVAEAGLTPADLGLLARTDVTDTTLANAAFGLPAGGFAIIPGIGGQRAVAVTEIDPGGAPGLEEVRQAIRDRLALADARSDFLGIVDQVEELRATLQPLTDIADRLGLEATELAITSGGPELSAVGGLPASDRARVAQAVFAAQEDRLEPSLTLSTNQHVWFDLKGVEAARDQTLDEVREAVTAAVTEERTSQALADQAAEVTGRVAAGTPLAEVAATLGQFVSVSSPIDRNGDGTPVLDRGVAAAAFAGGAGYVGSAENSDGDYVIFQVTDITAATAADATAASFVSEGTRNTLFSDFVAGLRNQYGVRENRAAIDQLLATVPTTAR